MDPRTSAQDVIRCDICETAVVQMHCDTCLNNLCKACVGEHISSEESKDHKVVKFHSRNTTPIYPRCAFHEKEQWEMFCKHCDIPVCHTCLESDQHLGHKLSNILQVLGEKKDLIRKENKELRDNMYPTYQDIAADVRNRMTKIEMEYGDLLTAIIKHGEDRHRELEQLVGRFKIKVNEMKTSQVQSLQKHLDDINKKIVNIEGEIDSLDTAADSNDISLPFSVRSNIHQYEKLPQKLVFSVPNFIPGTIQEEELFGTLSSISLKAEVYGYSTKTTKDSSECESHPPDKQKSEEVILFSETRSHLPVKTLLDIPETFDTNIFYDSEYLQNVECFGAEEMWTSGDSSTIRLFNISNGHLTFQTSITTKTGNWPSDITVSRSGNLIYTDNSEKTVNIVQIESMALEDDIEEVIRIKDWRPQAICSTSSGDLLVSMDSEDDKRQTRIVLFSGSMQEKVIQFHDNGIPLYSSGGSKKYICENRNLDICVADSGAKAVVVVNRSGNLRFRYTGHTPAPMNKSFNLKGITTDRRLLERYEETKSVKRRPKSGRPKSTTVRQDRQISLLAKRNRMPSAVSLNRELSAATGIRMSTQALRNRLHDVGLHARRPAVRPPLTVEHRNRRLQFAQDHINWYHHHIQGVLWTDESRFCLDFNDGRRRVWRKKNERYKDCCITEHDRFGCGSVMVWAGISYDGSTDLYVIRNGSLTGVCYRDEILAPIVRP
ncbi:uncharacterized protein LOC134273568 [Saccostrea cucullata]|uniref:uncharacterized protein LOC134273568 n=1 Tax=Saccostrea cuccullata TaxID=36930 RepID=UPI002ED2EF7C